MRRLVLVPGLGVSGRYFGPLVEVLRDLEPVAPDLRGHTSREAQAHALRALLGEGSALLGNSFGCQVIAELAARTPELVGKVIFVGPSVDRRHRSLASQAGRLLLDMTREPPALVATVARDSLGTGPVRLARLARSALEDALERDLPALKAPLLVVRGERDPLCPQAWAEEIARRAPRGRLEIVRGAAHAVHYSHPVELGALVRDFLEEPE